MNDNTVGVLMLCATCLIPFIAGVGSTLMIQSRVKRLGWWGLLPLGGLWKALYINHKE